MKKPILLILFFFLVIINLSFAQAVKLPTNRIGEVEFKETVQLENATADQLFARANKFFKDTYPNPKDIIDIDDKEAGKITGFGVYDGGNNYLVTYSIEINLKNGTYEYNFTPFSYILQINAATYSQKKQPFTAEQPREFDNKKWAVFTTNTYNTLTQLASQLKETMLK